MTVAPGFDYAYTLACSLISGIGSASSEVSRRLNEGTQSWAHRDDGFARFQLMHTVHQTFDLHFVIFLDL
jgi:hypothetical protein